MANILITEDEKIIAEDLKLTLQSFGHKISAICPSGEEAVVKARELHPDIILMDIKLEGDIDGIEAAKSIRKYLNTPIVFCTAYAENSTLEKVSCINSYAYLTKPFNDSELLFIINKILNNTKIDQTRVAKTGRDSKNPFKFITHEMIPQIAK